MDDAGVVDRAGQQTVTCARTQKHLAAIGLDQSAVGGQGVELALLHLQAQQLAACKVQAHCVACTQRHGAAGGTHVTLVRDTVTQQRHVSALGCVDLA